MKRLLLVPSLVGCGGASSDATPTDDATTSETSDTAGGVASDGALDATTDAALDGVTDASDAATAERVWGVTVDDVSNVPAVVDSLSKLHRRPTVRVVLDETEGPATYADAIPKFHAVASVMGELVDSLYVKNFTVAQYEQRTKDFLDAFAKDVDVWEVGNEINGEWVGPDAPAKIQAAYDVVKARGGKTALTLYWNASCYSDASHEMFAWTEKNVSSTMKDGLDWVLVSYYDDDCPGDKPVWPDVVSKLAAMFPKAKLGVGECGTERADAKADFVKRYYGMKLDHPRWIGGYFWWYFVGDMTPSSKPLFSVLDGAIE